ncbi:hypothetical protein M422DRAFT_236883 [Sphaerobolus stellatus SS14]|uniref:Unplaced genomic scaffold SPHSTscaffold_328, whole genome shotgun sequence n=1 Tax=Sphaerobolus stellatus (strain SS14) TaxID=990650 RepID=A0A0C9UK83_SPHS4|nr:hypothetical protein M422DRAFT_236883 [Sphaerobolus stellatus SS14]
MDSWITVIILGFILVIWQLSRSQKTAKPKWVSSIPKAKGRLPGNLDLLFQLILRESHEYCGETIREWAEKYGPTYDMNLLWGNQIITVDPSNVKHMLANDFESFGKGAKFHTMLETFLGSGIFTTDGDVWKMHRAIARPFFSAERVTDFECFERHTSRALDIMSEYGRNGETFDLQHILSRFTLNVGTDFLFGQDCSVSNEEYEAFSNAFNQASSIVARRVKIGSTWRFFEWGEDPTKEPMRIINAFVDPIMKQGMQAAAVDKPMEEKTFLEHLVDSVSDIKIVRDELLNVLLASRDTTASLLTYTIYSLVTNPHVCERARKEIFNTMGDRGEPTLIDIKKMGYLRAIINEVLRLFPPVPFNIRRCVKSSTLPSVLSKDGPFSIAPGISVTYSPLLIQRSTELWGPSACVFDPDRWLEEGSNKPYVTNPFSFLPFNGGPRMCMGQQFAYHETSYFIIRLLKTFSTVELAEDSRPASARPPTSWKMSNIGREKVEQCWPRASLTLYVSGGLWIRIKT